MRHLGTLLIAMAFGSSAFASGAFTCTSTDNTVVIEGGRGGNGSWVRNFTVDGTNYTISEGGKISQDTLEILGDFAIQIHNVDTGSKLLEVKAYITPDGIYAGGIVVLNGNVDEGKPITCELTY